MCDPKLEKLFLEKPFRKKQRELRTVIIQTLRVCNYTPYPTEGRNVRQADQARAPKRPKIYPELFLLLQVSDGRTGVVQRTVMRWVVVGSVCRTRYYLAVCQKLRADRTVEKVLARCELGAASFTWGENRLSRHRPID